MSSSATLLPHKPWALFFPSVSSSALLPPPHHLCSGVSFQGHGRGGVASSTCNAAPNARVIQGAIPKNLSVIERTQTLLDVVKEKTLIKVPQLDELEIGSRVNEIRNMLNSFGDGEISVSAYDTAWVALVKDVHGSGAPQFPSSLKWIVENQLSDGSWGDDRIFSAHDRIINTLGCVIALKSWNVQPHMFKKGVSFLCKNMAKLEEEDSEHMPIGFEVAFPSLIEIARSLDLNLSFDSPFLQEIYARRNLKLKKIPKKTLHQVPTTLLHSLEGMPDLDWEKLLKLQSPDGSFLFSPASTAFALMQTGDEKCLEYIQRAVKKFNGGVPNVYPVDLFEHLWAVDRLQRLGISRHFEPEIISCLEHVYRYWREDGICWARNSDVHDVDDTAMGFRLLRLHGYDISADVFRQFERNGEFFCFAGQSNQAVTGMYNLYRASYAAFPGEKILEDARTFSYKFLREKQASKQLLDKWIIAKDLPGEVSYALDFPWYASLPRIETRFYMEHYGGEEDVWIGKTLYRMPRVSNNMYLELAKLDFNKCQQMHQLEWREVQKWYNECNLGELGLTKRAALRAYFLAASSIFEPERATERLAWARTAALVEAFRSRIETTALRQTFLQDVIDMRSESSRATNGLLRALQHTLRLLAWEVLLAHGRDVQYQLKQAWEEWLTRWQDEGDHVSGKAELLVLTINLCAGRQISDDILSHPDYHHLSTITSHICSGLHHLHETKVQELDDGLSTERFIIHQGNHQQIDQKMQEITQKVLCKTDGLNQNIRQTFLTVAKSFYYIAHCPPSTLNLHIAKVLFKRVP